MPEPTLYLFDGYNLMHAGELRDRRELTDLLASFVALRGARGIVVFDGAGDEETLGPLGVRFAGSADHVIERLASEHRESDVVCVVSSDAAVRGTTGGEVRHRSSTGFLAEITAMTSSSAPEDGLETKLADALDVETRERLERWRRRRD